MSYKPNQIPTSPLAVSMLPDATEYHDNDVVYVVQPNNPAGSRSRKATLKSLRDNQVMIPKMFITSTAPNSGSWEVDLTGCFPYARIQLIRPSGRGDTSVDRVILKNIPADILMTVEISVDYGILTGSLLIHLESTDHLLGTLRAKYLDAGLGVFKNTTKNSYCQLPGTVSNEYQDLLVFRNLTVENTKLRTSGLDILTGSSGTYTYEPSYDTLGEATDLPVHTIVNRRSVAVKVTFHGADSNEGGAIVVNRWLGYAEALTLIPITAIYNLPDTPNKYSTRFAYIGGHDTDPTA